MWNMTEFETCDIMYIMLNDKPVILELYYLEKLIWFVLLLNLLICSRIFDCDIKLYFCICLLQLTEVSCTYHKYWIKPSVLQHFSLQSFVIARQLQSTTTVQSPRWSWWPTFLVYLGQACPWLSDQMRAGALLWLSDRDLFHGWLVTTHSLWLLETLIGNLCTLFKFTCDSCRW